MDLIVCALDLCILFMGAVFLEGLKMDIKAHVDVAVKAGEEAYLQCPLPYSSDVLQVMWQKILPEEEVTVATCLSTRHKRNPKFSSRIRLTGTGLQDCSLVVQNVTEQDEGCYLCLFITSSDVAYTGRTCLHTYELHGPVLNVTTSSSTGERVVSCSATGRPAPKITLHVPQRPRTHNSSVTHSNGTVTVFSTAVLSHHRDANITCSGTSPFEEKQVNTTAPASADIEHIQHIVSGSSAMDLVLWICLFCAFMVVGIVAAAVLLVKKKHQKKSVQRDNKNMENGGVTPLKKNYENGTVHKRTPMKDETSTKKSSRKLYL